MRRASCCAVADRAGATLRPSLAHGYSDRVLQRLGALRVDADNVTSLAFRSMQPQTLGPREDGSVNALAVPLITATGCVGVLAAEMGRQSADGEVLAVGRLFAAQLATLVSPADVPQAAADGRAARG